MDLAKMIGELQEERRRLDEAIEALERLSAGQTRRRGRPPRSHVDSVDQLPSPPELRSETNAAKSRKTL